VETALDLPPDKLDALDREFLDGIRQHGWFATRVFDPDGELPDFTYSTGFWLQHSLPELILFSLPKEVSHGVLWDVFRALGRGANLPIGVRLSDVFGNADAFLMPVAKRHYDEHLRQCTWFYRGEDFPCAHLIWPDKAGRFPWEPGFDEGMESDQPDLTENGWLTALAN